MMKYQLLLQIVVCPVCHMRLFLNSKRDKLICYSDNLFFPIKQGIPVLLSKEDCDLVSKRE